jgi:activator of HSP90 ATPase
MLCSLNPTQLHTRRRVLAGLTLSAGASALCATDSGRADEAQEIHRTMESIHQEISFVASRERVYAALTDAAKFHQVTLAGAAVQSGMVKATQATRISREPGGPFSLFGGHILGRQIELIPGRRIVQAWRPVDWQAGVYSIARFELLEQGSGTHLVFDHTGFPVGQAQHLAQGWRTNYWEPLAKILA